MGNFLCCHNNRNDIDGSIYDIQSLGTFEKMKSEYTFEKSILGEGSYGTVFKAQSSKDASCSYAVKQIKKPRIPEKLNGLRREINNMLTVDHPNIIKYHECFEDANHVYLVMEFCQQGTIEEMFKEYEIPSSLLDEDQRESAEKKAAEYMYYCCKALNHCHA